MRSFSLAYSPCPNDTFIFYALVHRKINLGNLIFKEVLEDVESLNKMAFKVQRDISKVSYHAFGYLRDKYALLRAGGALGKGCGPLIVGKEVYSKEELINKCIAIPGLHTTAFLLLKLYEPRIVTVIPMEFSKIMPAIERGDVDAGLIIHESRFIYPQYGLKQIIDLGDWWEKESGYPIPLGAIIIKRELGKEIARSVDKVIKESINYAFKNRNETWSYIKKYSQELEDSVIEDHINLYVNNYSLDIGEDGEKAVRFLFKEAEKKGIISSLGDDLFYGL